MAATTYTCVICGETVSRRKSYSLGEGDGKRACRTHEEAQVARIQIAEAEKKRKEDEKNAAAKKSNERAEKNRKFEFKPRCFICNQVGMRQDEFFTRWLIEQEKYELVTGKAPNPFDPEEMSKALEALKGERCLYFVRWAGKNKKKKVRFRTFQNIQMLEQMMGEAILLVCPECVKEKGFKTVTEERTEDVTLEGLVTYSAVYETVARPAVKAQARRELEERN